jgi:signal transduction histidine kinase
LIEVSVIDTGIGIKEENMDKLFKIGLNYTTPGTADEKGTGLGLIICKEMVEKSGGHIWAESTWGEGTTFKFTASAARPTAPDLDLKVIEKRLKSGGAEDE